MDFLYEWSIWKLLLFATLWAPPLALVHELGHAAAALALTRGPVHIGVTLLGGGRCAYDPGTLRGPARSEAWIAAAGPIASLIGTLALALLAGATSGELERILSSGALCSGLAVVLTAIPMRYGRGFGGAGESDGMAVWRILRGGPPKAARTGREPAVAGPVYLVLLGLALALAFLVDVTLGLVGIVIFAIALVIQSEKTA